MVEKSLLAFHSCQANSHAKPATVAAYFHCVVCLYNVLHLFYFIVLLLYCHYIKYVLKHIKCNLHGTIL